MLNLYKVKKWAALFLISIFSTMPFFIFTKFYNIWAGLGAYLIGTIVGIILANLLIKNPFTQMIEGDGVLAIDLSSTGVLAPFILKYNSKNELTNQKKGVNLLFDRSLVFSITNPIISKTKALLKWKDKETQGKGKEKQEIEVIKTGLNITLDVEEINRAKFGLWQYPVILWNSQLRSALTKDFLNDREKEAFAEHGILYLNRKTEELSGHIRDFGRAVVESLKPQVSIFANKWVIWIIIILIAILAIMFLPKIINVIGGSVGNGVSMPSALVTPR